VLTAILRLLKTRLVAAEAHQRRMALRDSLTGLVNRRGFDDALRAAVAARGSVESGRRESDDAPGCALIVFDLDGFKQVNDSAGHPAGDRLLRGVAAAGAAIVRPTDTLARIGGDEFALIAPGAGIVGAARLAQELLDAIHEAGAQATVAWAVHPDDGETGEDLLRVADRRLYEGKASAPGSVVGAEPA
jgi:diguanylate cyclase (GGDEF)-like protein